MSKPQHTFLLLGSALVVGALAVMLSAGAAQATYVVNVVQSGADVVASGSGMIDLNGLNYTNIHTAQASPLIQTNSGSIFIGGQINTSVDPYAGISGPMSLGSLGLFIADSSTGDIVGVQGNSALLDLPTGYGSGDPLSSSAKWDHQTFASLGLTSGSYTWTWGSGAHADSFVLNIGTSVPEPATISIFGFGLAGLGFMLRRRRTA